jgi:hypothetical protein
MIFFLFLFFSLYCSFDNNLINLTQTLSPHIQTQIIFHSKDNENIKNNTKDFFDFLNNAKVNNNYHQLKSHKVNSHKQEKKQWTVLIYVAGVNDLYKYALRNIEQMIQVGSNDQLNILIHFDFHIKGKTKETKHFYVEKNNLLQIGDLEPQDSGDINNLIAAVKWAETNYPSTYFSLILWNHGTGSCDPHFMRKIVNPNDFFFYDKKNNKISLDRSKEFLKYIENKDEEITEKGICFDDTTRNYLDNKKLSLALEKIYQLRNQKKIDVLLMDAC